MGELVIAPVDLTEPKTSHKGFINGLEITLNCTEYIFLSDNRRNISKLGLFLEKNVEPR